MGNLLNYCRRRPSIDRHETEGCYVTNYELPDGPPPCLPIQHDAHAIRYVSLPPSGTPIQRHGTELYHQETVESSYYDESYSSSTYYLRTIVQNVHDELQQTVYEKLNLGDVNLQDNDVEQQTGEVKEQVGDMKRQIRGLEKDTYANIKFGRVQHQIGDVEQDVDDVNQQVRDIVNQVFDVEGRVGDEEKDVGHGEQQLKDDLPHIKQQGGNINQEVSDVQRLLDDIDKHDFYEEQERNSTDEVDPVDILLEILSKDVSSETIIEKTNKLLKVEQLHLNVKDLMSAVKKGQPPSDMRQNVFDTLFNFYGNELLTTLQFGKHSADLLEAALRYVLDVKDMTSSKRILDTAGEKLKSEINNPHCLVWAGLNFRAPMKGEVTLVCFHIGYLKTRPATFLGLPVLYRLYDKIEREPLNVCLSEEYSRTLITDENSKKATKLINARGEELFERHSNLEAIRAGSIISSKSKGLVKTMSIVLYCRMKGVIPFGENFFPKEMKNEDVVLPTDVREGFFSFGMLTDMQYENPTDKLRMGCGIVNEDMKYSGTLGPFVNLDSKGTGFITCAHVVGLYKSEENKKVFRVRNSSPGVALKECGQILTICFQPDEAVGIDAALVKVNTEVEPTEFVTAKIPSSLPSFSANDPPSFRGGKVLRNITISDDTQTTVIKCGMTTGLTKGYLVVEGSMIQILNTDKGIAFPGDITWNGKTSVVMKGQYLVENAGYPFFTLGDSGAGVYLVEEDRSLSLIGIAIGVLDNFTVVTPIGPLLDSLELTEQNMDFPEPMQIDNQNVLYQI